MEALTVGAAQDTGVSIVVGAALATDPVPTGGCLDGGGGWHVVWFGGWVVG